jgi:hypothetical protein
MNVYNENENEQLEHALVLNYVAPMNVRRPSIARRTIQPQTTSHRQDEATGHVDTSQQMTNRSRITDCHLTKVTIRCNTCIFRCSKQ